jgi:hypothetical protein
VSIYAGIGFSNSPDIELAAKNAAFSSKTKLAQDRIDVALVFSTMHYDPTKTLPVINRVLNNAKIIGCSTAGILLSESIQTKGIAVITLSSNDTKFGVGHVNSIPGQDAKQAGGALAQATLEDFGPHTRHIFLFFTDGRLNTTPLLVNGVQNSLGPILPIVGAGSSDDFNFQHSFQIFQKYILQNSAVGLMIGGNPRIGTGTRHGWKPLGKPRIITKSESNIIRSIDGKPASLLYLDYFGEEAQSIVGKNRLSQMNILYPLGLRMPGGDEYLLRNAVDILSDGSIVCQGDAPEGSEVHIMIGNKDTCRQAVKEAAQEAHSNLLGKEAKLVIVLESMARLKLLGRLAAQEVAAIREVFGPKTPIAGMYSNGEVSPLQTTEKNRQPYFQNESIIVLAIG